jgi:hypothetical protein
MTKNDQRDDQQREDRNEESKMLPISTSDLAQSMHTSN